MTGLAKKIKDYGVPMEDRWVVRVEVVKVKAKVKDGLVSFDPMHKEEVVEDVTFDELFPTEDEARSALRKVTRI